MSDYFETRVENLEPKEEKKKSLAAVEKPKDEKFTKKRKRVDSNFNVVESRKEYSVEHKTTKKYCILSAKCRYSTDICKNLCATVIKYKQRK